MDLTRNTTQEELFLQFLNENNATQCINLPNRKYLVKGEIFILFDGNRKAYRSKLQTNSRETH